MGSTEDRVDAIVNTVSSLRKKKEQAVGALSITIKNIKDKYGCNSLKEAEKLEQKMAAELADKEKKLDSLIDAYESKWGDLL